MIRHEFLIRKAEQPLFACLRRMCLCYIYDSNMCVCVCVCACVRVSLCVCSTAGYATIALRICQHTHISCWGVSGCCSPDSTHCYCPWSQKHAVLFFAMCLCCALLILASYFYVYQNWCPVRALIDV